MSGIEPFVGKIICGDALVELRKIPAESINSIMTSPPYWNLRNYNIIGQLGLEKTLETYLVKLWQIADELFRVLRKDGTMFWNHGDSYGGSGGDHKSHHKNDASFQGKLMRGSQSNNYLPKCLLSQNEQFIQGLINPEFRSLIEWKDQGGPEGKLEEFIKKSYPQWILRNRIIWAKTNPMPSSVRDRFTNTYEPVYFLVKNNITLYWINQKTGSIVDKQPPGIHGEDGLDWEWRACPNCIGFKSVNERKACKRRKGIGKVKISFWQGEDYWFNLEEVRESVVIESIARKNRGISNHHKYADKKNMGGGGGLNAPRNNVKDGTREKVKSLPGRNPGDVWELSTGNSSLEHFATFPKSLVRRCILAGCPRQVCKACGKPRYPIVEPGEEYKKLLDNQFKVSKELEHEVKRKTGKLSGSQRTETYFNNMPAITADYHITGFSDCGCGAGFEGGICLDPFAGTSTVLLVAKNLERRYIGIELNPKYVAMSETRLAQKSLWEDK